MSKEAAEEPSVKEFARLTKQNRHLQRVIQGYRSRLPPVAVPQSLAANHSSTENGSQLTSKEPPEPARKHYAADWQRYCTDCGEPNEQFKDETECRGCKMHLGSIEEVQKIKYCPNCKGKDIRILDGAAQKARELKLVA